jgi:hypothetical protein
VGNSKIHRIPKDNCVPILKVYLYWPIIDALYIYNPRLLSMLNTYHPT